MVKIDEEIRKVLEKFADGCIDTIKLNMGERYADSNMAKSLRSDVDSESVKIWGADYIDYVQEGSKPWSGAGDGSFIKKFDMILYDWMSRYKISVPEPRKFVSNVKWKIIREGSRRYRHPEERLNFMSDVFEKNKEILEKSLFDIFYKEISKK